ncbi:hypothetical protein FGO68_gene2 [Halteria grandinella]|uniref:Uncharacterized protein n=1 Tax=Halteria grandinella TaxID=5974 RepID=A0A8J8SVQ9_HALGN|nr:hypothetical protein FGO68_gene2 [Halteria grandinella]
MDQILNRQYDLFHKLPFSRKKLIVKQGSSYMFTDDKILSYIPIDHPLITFQIVVIQDLLNIYQAFYINYAKLPYKYKSFVLNAKLVYESGDETLIKGIDDLDQIGFQENNTKLLQLSVSPYLHPNQLRDYLRFAVKWALKACLRVNEIHIHVGTNLLNEELLTIVKEGDDNVLIRLKGNDSSCFLINDFI